MRSTCAHVPDVVGAEAYQSEAKNTATALLQSTYILYSFCCLRKPREAPPGGAPATVDDGTTSVALLADGVMAQIKQTATQYINNMHTKTSKLDATVAHSELRAARHRRRGGGVRVPRLAIETHSVGMSAPKRI